MKDPTTDILTAFNTALASITYGSETIQVFNDIPEIGVRRYILVNPPTLSDDITASYFESDCSLDIEVCVRGMYHQANVTHIASIASSVQQAIMKVDMSMTSFSMGVTPYLASSTYTRQKEGNEIITKKLINVRFTVKEN